jgi:hypothetical protein
MGFSPDVSTLGQIYVASGGTASDNLVMDGNAGIRANGPTTIIHNSVRNCTTGIDARGGGSLIGNAVAAYIGQTALHFDSNGVNPVVADQNSFYLNSATFSSGTFLGKWGLNGGGPPQ